MEFNVLLAISSKGKLNYLSIRLFIIKLCSWENYVETKIMQTVFYMSSFNHHVVTKHICHFLLPNWLICVTAVTLNAERPVKRRSTGNEESWQTASFPHLLGSYLWGLSSGSFKWGLVTAGTSWTKLLLQVRLLCCSHSPLIGFDCICLNPQWKKEKGGWRCCSETEVC